MREHRRPHAIRVPKLAWHIAVVAIAFTNASAEPAKPIDQAAAKPELLRALRYFEPAAGSPSADAQFTGRTTAMSAVLGDGSFTFILPKKGGKPALIEMKIQGARAGIQAQALEPMQGFTSYLATSNEALRNKAIPHYGRVRYPDVYPSIDLEFYFQEDQIEYDFVVRPGGDPNKIAFSFSGVEQTAKAENGDLVLKTHAGEFRHRAPRVYQADKDGKQVEVAASYRINGAAVGFEVAAYDPKRKLTIDPILIFASFFGGSGFDSIVDMAVDSTGAVYVVGDADSTGFPLLWSIKNDVYPGVYGYVAKFKPNTGSGPLELVYSSIVTGLHAGSKDYPAMFNVAVDSQGRVYIQGQRIPGDMPQLSVPAGWNCSRQENLDKYPSFVMRLRQFNPPANNNLWVDYGFCAPKVNDMQVSNDGFLYLGGATADPNFPVKHSIRPAQPGYYSDAFVIKLRPEPVEGRVDVVYATLLGGSDNEGVAALALGLDDSVYVVGTTESPDFPLVRPWIQQQPFNNRWDGFFARLKPAGLLPVAIAYSTYIGCNGGDTHLAALAVDYDGTAYIGGMTMAVGFPTVRAFQSQRGSAPDGLLIAFPVPAPGTNLAPLFSTYYGGAGDEWIYNVALDHRGGIYISGGTSYFKNDQPDHNAIELPPGADPKGFIAKLWLPSPTSSLARRYSMHWAWTNAMVWRNGFLYLGGGSSSVMPLVNQRQAYAGSNGHGYLAKIKDETTMQILSVPTGAPVKVEGDGCDTLPLLFPTPRQLQPDIGEKCKVTFPQETSYTTRWTFMNWADGGTENERTITVGAHPSSYTGIVKKEHRLETHSLPLQGGTVEPAGTTWQLADRYRRVRAIPAVCYAFGQWSGNAPDGEVYMYDVQIVTAFFVGDAAQPANQIFITKGPATWNPATSTYMQMLTLKNNGPLLLNNISLAFDNLPPGFALTTKTLAGMTKCAAPSGSPYANVGLLPAGQSLNVVMEFSAPANTGLNYTVRALYGGGQR